MRFSFSKDLRVDEHLRKELSKPFGRIMNTKQFVQKISRHETIYAIGDVTVSELLKNGYVPKVGIFDYRTERSAVYFPIIRDIYKKPVRVKNSRGAISHALWNSIKKASKSKKGTGIRVSGEEDLASLVCLYFARDGNLIVYGMRNSGVAVIRANKKIRSYVIKVLERMAKIKEVY